jgi:hypothetical protein
VEAISGWYMTMGFGVEIYLQISEWYKTMGFGVVVCLQIVQMIIMIRMIGLNEVNLYYKHYFQNMRYSIYGSFFFDLYFDCASKISI